MSYPVKPKFRINNSYASPISIDYDLLGLHKFEYIELTNRDHRGELVKVEYYKNLHGDPNNVHNYSELVLVEHRAYTRDPISALLIYRTQKVDWYLEDNTIGETLTQVKYYQIKDAIDEGQERRDNIIAQTKVYLLAHIGLENGRILLADVTPYINTYLQGNHDPLLQAVHESTRPFMTPIIKATAISILDF